MSVPALVMWREVMYRSEHFMVVCVPKSTFLRSGNWCPERREKYDILRVLLENVFNTSLNETCHGVKVLWELTPIVINTSLT